MPKGYPWKACRRCRREVDDRLELSRTGLCLDCAEDIRSEQVRQLVAHRGPQFEHWRRRCLASFGVVVDD